MDDDDAVRWAIRLDGGQLDEDEQSELDRWLGEDQRREGALLRAEAALAYLDRGRALGEVSKDTGALQDLRIEAPRFSRRAFLVGGTLSGLAAAGLGAFLILPPRAAEIQTKVGEVRRVPLPDGSVAAINTASRLAVSMKDGSKRIIRLDQGEAWFQVAHDRVHPFIVEAGDVRVQAVGTAFSVRRRDGGADVLVTEGVVETWIVGREGQRTRIAAGGRGFVSDATPKIQVAKAPEEVDRALAWRTGEIALNGESLAYAVAEINRYNKKQLIIDDPVLGRESLVGYFRTNEPENFGRAVANMTGAKLVDEGDKIRLTRS
jgi:transmembrane sensor